MANLLFWFWQASPAEQEAGGDFRQQKPISCDGEGCSKVFEKGREVGAQRFKSFILGEWGVNMRETHFIFNGCCLKNFYFNYTTSQNALFKKNPNKPVY